MYTLYLQWLQIGIRQRRLVLIDAPKLHSSVLTHLYIKHGPLYSAIYYFTDSAFNLHLNGYSCIMTFIINSNSLQELLNKLYCFHPTQILWWRKVEITQIFDNISSWKLQPSTHYLFSPCLSRPTLKFEVSISNWQPWGEIW